MKTPTTIFANYSEARFAITEISGDLEAIEWLGKLQRTYEHLNELQTSPEYKYSNRDAAQEAGFGLPDYEQLEKLVEWHLDKYDINIQVSFQN